MKRDSILYFINQHLFGKVILESLARRLASIEQESYPSYRVYICHRSLTHSVYLIPVECLLRASCTCHGPWLKRGLSQRQLGFTVPYCNLVTASCVFFFSLLFFFLCASSSFSRLLRVLPWPQFYFALFSYTLFILLHNPIMVQPSR